MKTGLLGIQLIKVYESLHDNNLKKIGLQPKMCPAGIWTSGYGRAIIDPRTGKFLKGIANKEYAETNFTVADEKTAMNNLLEDLVKYENIVKSKIKVVLTQNQFDALVSHTYNTGGSDTLFKLINDKATDQVIYNWFTTKYTTANGVVLRGLVSRRKSEADLYFKK